MALRTYGCTVMYAFLMKTSMVIGQMMDMAIDRFMRNIGLSFYFSDLTIQRIQR